MLTNFKSIIIILYMRFLLILFTLATVILPVQAGILLTGEVEYTTDSARYELINSIPQKSDEKFVSIYLKDKNYKENISALLKGFVELKDRTLAMFSDNSYAVMYHNDKLHVFYYAPNGSLTHYELKDGIEYPYKSYKYDINGNLVNMGLRVSKAETYIFSPNGKLIAHWIKENGYYENGNVIMTRKYLD